MHAGKTDPSAAERRACPVLFGVASLIALEWAGQEDTAARQEEANRAAIQRARLAGQQGGPVDVPLVEPQAPPVKRVRQLRNEMPIKCIGDRCQLWAPFCSKGGSQ
jgi:hypothetical protein